MPAPIALFVYNRLDHSRQTIEALKKNTLANESHLVIFSDGPKTGMDKQVIELRDYLKTITGFKSVTIEESIKNKGLANSIIDGVTTMISQYGMVIVVEDDLVTSPFFLEYMNNGLSLYANDEKVISIHGYVYPTKKKLPETFFLKGADCWGWATWKRGWDLFESNGSELLMLLEKRNLLKKFDYDNSASYVQMLRDQIDKKNNSWAIRWYASAFLNNKLTLYPGISYVENIGIDGSGTHCGDGNANKFKDLNGLNQIGNIRKIPIFESRKGRKEFKKYFNSFKIQKKKQIIDKLFHKLLKYI